MRTLCTAGAISLLLLACSKAPEAPASPQPAIAWVRPEGASLEAVFAQARQADKPVFLYWGAVWCPPCNQIKATVFNRPDFAERSKSFIAVYLDGDTPGAQKLGAQFKVRGYPTMILFKPDGSELTRLPGEVDAAKYMEVLGLALNAGASVKASLAAALGKDAAALSPQAWRQLAYYAWEQDEAQLVPEAQRAATLRKLAKACPSLQPEAASRLALKAIAATAQDKTVLPERPQALALTRAVLADAALARVNFDTLVYYGNEIVGSLSGAGSAERKSLTAEWLQALSRFAADTQLARSDRLSAVAAKIALARLDLPEGARPRLEPALVAEARAAASAAERETSDRFERQAVLPGAADLLSDAGLFDESDALLNAELPKAVSPYYHMLVLAANARARGDKPAALAWSERAWNESAGPATRLQWGSSHVGRLIELAPQDAARIEKAAGGVIAELEAAPETFYERNRRGLEKMAKRLRTWSDKGHHEPVLRKLGEQLEQVCARLPAQDEARKACSGVFNPRSGAQKA